MMNQTCPLCEAEALSSFYRDSNREYFRCGCCSLVSVPSTQFLSYEDEKARYDLHQNSPDDQEYRRFLNRIFIPMKERLSKGSFGLDFGSGPGPTLSVMFSEIGHSMAIYDRFYADSISVLKNKFDFITATEVVEHLHKPKEELNMLWDCLKPGGWLGIMTKLALDRDAFINWHYKNDPTHVCFFSKTTFKWLANWWKGEANFVGKDVILFQKNSLKNYIGE